MRIVLKIKKRKNNEQKIEKNIKKIVIYRNEEYQSTNKHLNDRLR